MAEVPESGCAPNAVQRRQTRRERILARLERVVPWHALLEEIRPYWPRAERGRKPYALEVMLRIHLMQVCWHLSDPQMEDELYEITSMRRFAGLPAHGPTPDESTILNFRHLLERHALCQRLFDVVNAALEQQGLLMRKGTLVDASIIAAPSSTKNCTAQRDPEMGSTRKGKQWYFGMKAHIGVDADSGLVHTVVYTAANVHDVTQSAHLLHGQERDVFGDAGYVGMDKREQVKERHPGVGWHAALRAGQRRALDQDTQSGRLREQLERIHSSIRARVEHPFRVIKRQFGYAKVRYKGLRKNAARLHILFALSNLWMASGQRLAAWAGQVRPVHG